MAEAGSTSQAQDAGPSRHRQETASIEQLVSRMQDVQADDAPTRKLILREAAAAIGGGGGGHEADPKSVRRVYEEALRHCTISSLSVSGDALLEEAAAKAAALRLLHVVLSLPRDPHRRLEVSAEDVRSCVECLLVCVHFSPPSPPRGPSAPPIRGGPVGIESEAVTSTDCGSDAGGGSSVAGDERKRMLSTARTVRQNALSCLSALHEGFAPTLFSSWPQLLDAGSGASTSSVMLGLPPRRPATRSLLTVIRDDPVLSVRLSACQLVTNMFRVAGQRGFLAAGIVEPRAAAGVGHRPAFTSLSARIATTIADARGLLAGMLLEGDASSVGNNSSSSTAIRGAAAAGPARRPIPPSLLESLLRCTKTLVSATSTARLRRSHADVLREPIVRLTSHSDASVAITAFSALTSLSPAAKAAAVTTPNEGAVLATPLTSQSAVFGLIAKLQQDTLEGDALAKAWSALSTFATGSNGGVALLEHQQTLLGRAARHLEYDDQVLRQACIAFIADSLDSNDDDGSSSDGPHRRTLFTREYADIIATASRDHSSLVRTEATRAIPGAILLASCDRNGSGGGDDAERAFADLSTVQSLNALLADPEPVTRAGAIRAVGVVLTSSEAAVRDSSGVTAHAIGALRLKGEAGGAGPLFDTALLVRLRASWTFANLVQAICRRDQGKREAASTLLASIVPLIQDDERIAANGLRAAGLLLSSLQMDDEVEPSSSSTIEPVVSAILHAIDTAKTPKTKWNAVNALSTCVSSGPFREWARARTALYPRIACSIAGQLRSKTFKVKLAAIAGLSHLDKDADGDGETRSYVLASVDEALANVEREVDEATFKEAQVHGEATKRGLAELKLHVDRVWRQGNDGTDERT